MARQIHRLAIPIENRNAQNPILSSTDVMKSRWRICQSLRHLPCQHGSGQSLIGKNVYPQPQAPDLRLAGYAIDDEGA